MLRTGYVQLSLKGFHIFASMRFFLFKPFVDLPGEDWVRA